MNSTSATSKPPAPGDEPAPQAGQVSVPDQALADFNRVWHEQSAKGQARYGTVLQTFNGRDAGHDAQQELVDAFQYVTQLRLEHAEALQLLTVMTVWLQQQQHKATVYENVYQGRLIARAEQILGPVK